MDFVDNVVCTSHIPGFEVSLFEAMNHLNKVGNANKYGVGSHHWNIDID